MEGPRPTTSASNAATILQDLGERLASDDNLFGERLITLGSVPAPISGPVLLATDATGATVAIAPLVPLTRSSAARLAEEMDRLGRSSVADLERNVGLQPESEKLSEGHGSLFQDEVPAQIDPSQRLIVILPRAPTTQEWRILHEELGAHLSDVFEMDRDGLRRASPPQAQSGIPTSRPAQRDSSGGRNLFRAALPLGTWLGIAALIAGTGLILLGVMAALREDEVSPPEGTFLQSPIRTVASEVDSTATFTRWVGQQRIVRVGGNRLLVLFMGDRGLEIVSDERNQGRTWRSAISVPGVSAESFSVAADGKGRLHLALSDQGNLRYLRLTRTISGWESGDILDLSESATEVVNIAWDAASGTAHVVWAEDSPDGERPYWAAVEPGDGTPTTIEERSFAESGGESSVLATVGSYGDGRLITAYREASDSDWYSRVGSFDEFGSFTWEPEEKLPMEDFAGAASLAVDDDKVAHLVLRDDDNARIVYFRRLNAGGWTGGETAVDASSSDEIDLPTVSIDSTSRLVYVFFADTSGEQAVPRVAIRDPATRWEGPDAIAGEGEITQGATHPATMERSEGQPIVIWTTQGAEPAIQSARISAP